MNDRLQIQDTVREFIRKNFVFDPNTSFTDDESLLGTGVIDSTGILELIGFLEEKYRLQFEDNELIGENFDTVQKITAFLSGKLAQQN